MMIEQVEIVEVPGMRVWQAPVVNVFGGAVELTASGTGATQENSPDAYDCTASANQGMPRCERHP